VVAAAGAAAILEAAIMIDNVNRLANDAAIR
jgi:hypothetical protein